MKKTFAFISILLLGLLSVAQTPQNFNLNDTIKLFNQIIYGKLDNGLTYYILKNSKPKNRAYLQLAVNAGSIHEDDDQKGLAHMCEHMAFNGTKNFPKKELINFLESIGMKFGAELNAYTSFDETVYMIEVPLDKEEYLRKGLLVLHDWASAVSFEDEEVINERGIIFEEWRLGRGPEDRLGQKTYPVLFYGSKYAESLPIGDTAVFKYCPPENLRRFYRDWYRPDLQAIVAVGDFDPQVVEKIIKEIFSQIPKRQQVRQHFYAEMPSHNDIKAIVATDPEARYSVVQYIIKHPTKKIVTFQDLRQSIVRVLISSIMQQRLRQIANNAKSPIVVGFGYYTQFVGYTDMLAIFAIPKSNRELDAAKLIAVELARARQYGFTQSELKLAKDEFLSQSKKDYEDRNKIESERWASMIQRNFSQFSIPVPGFETEYAFNQWILPQITIEDLNNTAKELFSDKNNVVILTGSDKNIKITTQELLEAVQNIDKNLIVPYQDKQVANTLIDKKLKPGKVVRQELETNTDTRIWTLKNGVKVVLKSTDFKDNEILLQAYSPGGFTLYELQDNCNARACVDIAQECGLGKFNKTDLENFLSTKNVELSPYIGKFSEGFRGKSTKEDFETMLQLVYLYFTAPRFDENGFNSYIERQKTMLENKNSNPNSLWQDQIQKTLSNNSKFVEPFTLESLQKINLKRAEQIYKERFADPSSFTFVIVGNINYDIAKPLIEKYLGGLPKKDNNEKPNYRDLKITADTRTDIVYAGTEQKSMVLTFLQSFEPNTLENEIYLNAISYILDDSLIDQIREQKQWTYSISAYPRIYYEPLEIQLISIFYSCQPDRVDIINNEILRIANSLKNGQIAQTEIDKTIQKLRRQREIDLKKNEYWIDKITDMHIYNRTADFVTEYDKIVNNINEQNLKKFATKLLKNTYLSVALKPKN